MPTTAQADRHENDQTFVRPVQFLDTVSVPADSFGNDQISASDPLDATKLRHRHVAGHAQPNTAATTETRGVYAARAAGTVLAVRAWVIGAATGDSTVTVNVLKQGVSVLTGSISITSGTAARTPASGTLVGSPTYAAGNTFEVVITATAGSGTLPTGLAVQIDLDEAAT